MKRRIAVVIATVLALAFVGTAQPAGAWGYTGPYYNQWTPNYLAPYANINHWSAPGTRVIMHCWFDLRGQRWFRVTPYDWGGGVFYVKSYYVARQSVVGHC